MTNLSQEYKARRKAAIKSFLQFARSGKFGTPERPLRNGGDRHTFWACYFGHRKVSEFYGTCSYPAAKAGVLYRKEKDSTK